jgi:hypothetical protein
MVTVNRYIPSQQTVNNTHAERVFKFLMLILAGKADFSQNSPVSFIPVFFSIL